jgi:hypothetical protein
MGRIRVHPTNIYEDPWCQIVFNDGDIIKEIMTIARKTGYSWTDRGSRPLKVPSLKRVKSPTVEMDTHLVIRVTSFVLI